MTDSKTGEPFDVMATIDPDYAESFERYKVPAHDSKTDAGVREDIAKRIFWEQHTIMHDHEKLWQECDKRFIYLDCADRLMARPYFRAAPARCGAEWQAICDSYAEENQRLSDQLAAVRRCDAVTEQLRAALRDTLCELTACANQLAARGLAGREGDSVSRAQAAARAALSLPAAEQLPHGLRQCPVDGKTCDCMRPCTVSSTHLGSPE